MDEAETKLAELAQAPPGGWTFDLVVSGGPDDGKLLTLDGSTPRRMVGKSRLCHLSLSDPEVSRRHATVESTAAGLHVQDLGSKNGTYVSGVRVASAFALGGETVRIGATELVVRRRNDAQAPLVRTMRFGRLVGASPAMRKLYPALKRLAESDVSVVIAGATGTGKELVAETLHEEGPRHRAAFVALDCAALSPTHADEALLGDTSSGRAGVFEQADGGTLFLDEVGDLDPGVQAKLLGILERRRVTRPGGETVDVDVRVIAATQRDLEKEVQEGRFREDLYFRLAVADVELPSLSSREGDVALLARHFWSKLGGRGEMPSAAVERFARADWPGNVRQLRNAVARLVALGEEAGGADDEQPKEADGGADREFERVIAQNLPLPVARQKIVDAFERRYLERALERSGGNVSAAAASSGIARRYFYVLKNRLSTAE